MVDSIAVIISTYNNPAFLRLVLEGYRKQTDRDFSIYIADDGSTRETRELIEQFQSDFPVPIRHLWHEDNGFRKARVHNMALSTITEPYLLLTDGDCIPLPGMVATHKRLATEGAMLSGGRILLSQQWTHALTNGESPARSDASLIQWFVHRLKGDINRILPMMMPVGTGKRSQKLSGIRGCHLSCWREDLVRVNGFDEAYEGWGREDSDLVARLFHSGISRIDLRGMPVLHLWHREEERNRLNENDQLLEECLSSRRIRAIKGLNQLEESL